MKLRRGDIELVALLSEIERQGWEITPEQDEELLALVADTRSAASELFWNDAFIDRVKRVEKAFEKMRKAMEVGDTMLRARLARVMNKLPGLETTKSGNPKTEDESGYCTVFLSKGSGAVDLAPGFEVKDVDPMYVEQKVEVTLVINKKLAADEFRRLEALSGQKPEIRGLVWKKEPYVKLVKTDRGKEALLAVEADSLLKQLGMDGGTEEPEAEEGR